MGLLDKRLRLKIHGNTYDVTEYVSQHPGGRKILEDRDVHAARNILLRFMEWVGDDWSLVRFRYPGLNKVTDLVKFKQIPLGDCANLSVIVGLK